MAPALFVFPPSLASLEDEYEDGRICALKPYDIKSLPPSQLDDFVKGVSFDLSDSEVLCVEEQGMFDRVYSLVRDFTALTTPCKINLIESLRSNLSVLLPNVDCLARTAPDNDSLIVDRLVSYGNAFKIYTYFLFTIVVLEESNNTSTNSVKVTTATAQKKQSVKSYNWDAHRSKILNLISNSLEINLGLLFGSSDPDENYLSFISKTTFSLFESQTLLKDSGSKDALCRITGTCATKYHYVSQACASMLYLIHKYDYVIIHMAEAAAAAERKFADGSLAMSLLGEIGKANPKDYVKDSAGAENIGRFLVELADRLPKLVAINIGVLISHFAGESYKIRNALVGVLGKLVAKAFKDVDGEVSSKSVRLRAKQAMLQILLERCRDVSAYTRGRVLQVWTELCEEHSVPIGLWNEVAEIASGRLEDKSAIVRKNALNLLVVMLQHNPFGPQLRVASFEATLEQYKRKLRDLEPSSETITDETPCDTAAVHVDGDIDNSISQDSINDYKDSLTDSCNVEDVVQKENFVPDIGNLEQTRALVASLEVGVKFSKCISATMHTLVQLMASPSATDVENSILLLMRCKQFQIDGSEICLRKMLPLVFSQDRSIYEAVENAFITIYVAKSALQTAKNLLSLALESNVGDLAALEYIIAALASKGDLSMPMISSLWDIFCFNIPGTTADHSRAALHILCMAAKSCPGILVSHIQDIIDIGFGRWSKVEPLLARTACIALQRLSDEEKTKILLSNGNRIFGILESLITSHSLPESIWYAAADKVISAIYSLHPTPEILAAEVVKKCIRSVFDNTPQDGPVNESEPASNYSTVKVENLSRCLFVASHIAMNHLVYIESCIRKIRKQKVKREKTQANNESVEQAASADARKDAGINAELGLAASEDAVLDTLAEAAEKEIVSGHFGTKYLIGSCAQFLMKLCRNFGLMQKYPDLQASGMLALCRFMIIDAEFCSENLQLLFTIVENAPSESVRSNCTIALADLAVRFPNLLEPWTENMYARLRDPSASVRKNAVLVLSHLILNDMMKVKGFINEMALRMEDEDERITNLARLFFHELSKKGSNPIYNLLPDILSKLSQQNLKRDLFCNIMQFLIGSIKKDKQMEALVEKLCSRFTGSGDTMQWEYISYCLSQLAFTEKGLKKLIDLFKVYENALSNECVMEHFRVIVNKSKKSAKPELRSCIDEFEEKLNKVHMENKELENVAKNAQNHQKGVSKRVGYQVKNNTEEDSAELEEEGEVTDESLDGVTTPTRSQRQVTNPTPADSDEHSDLLNIETSLSSGYLEVESPCINSRVKNTIKKDVKGKTSVFSKRTLRSRQKVVD
uniref:Condensin-1 complex subunit CAP-D2 n=1 Tax=Kalanchoe fedtschenkoi TaxID=63787 RepID=A0A7N0ZW93_KALFE